LAFDSRALAEATRWSAATTSKLEEAARRAVSQMAATRDAHRARWEARRRARRAEATARRLENEMAVESARELLLEDFARRMASMASRRARDAFARGAPLADAGDVDALDASFIRRALEEARDVANRLAPTPAAPNGFRETETPERAVESFVGSSPDAYFRALRSPWNGNGDDDDDDAADFAEDLDGSFRTARGDVSLNDCVDAAAPSTPAADRPIAVGTSPDGDALSSRSCADSLDPSSLPAGSVGEDLEGDGAADARDADGVDRDEPREKEISSEISPEISSEISSVSLEPPFVVILERCVLTPLRDARRVFSSLVVRAFVDHLGVEKHVQAVDSFLLCGAGDFASALVEGVAAAAARARVAGWGVTPAAVGDALERAVRASSAGTDPLAARWRLRARAPDLGSGRGGGQPPAPDPPLERHYRGIPDAQFSEHHAGMVDFLDASYALEWPLGVLFPASTRLAFAAAHRQLLRFRHVALALGEAHSRAHEAGNAYVSARADGGTRGLAGKQIAARRLRRVSLLSHELRHFVSAAEAAAGEACRGEAKRLFLEKCGSAKDAYGLRDAVSAYAARCAEACLLSPRDARAREAVDLCLQLALDFRRVARDGARGEGPGDGEPAARLHRASRLLTDGATYAALQSTHARFRVAATRLCECLRDAAGDIGGSLGGIDPRRASNWLGRLDQNGFYLRGKRFS
jgi:hypothetical protein